MTAVRTSSGADPELGREVLRALEVATLACAPGSAQASDLDAFRRGRSNLLSRPGLSRTDLDHRTAAKHVPSLSISIVGSRPVTVDIMCHEADGPDMMPATTDEKMRPNALRAIGTARREVEGWLSDGDDEDAYEIACAAIAGCAPAVFEATRGMDPTSPADHVSRLWMRHGTAWSSIRAGMGMTSRHSEEGDAVLRHMMGELGVPPVTTLVFEKDRDILKLTIGAPVACVRRDQFDVIKAMRSLNEAHERMRRRT